MQQMGQLAHISTYTSNRLKRWKLAQGRGGIKIIKRSRVFHNINIDVMAYYNIVDNRAPCVIVKVITIYFPISVDPWRCSV